MNTWTRIKNHLVATGRMDENGNTRRVTARTCRTCHAPVLSALDADVCAGTAVVDPTPVSAVGEALAVLTGRATYALRHVGGRYQLTRRSDFAIKGSPAGTKPYDVLADHVCGAPPLPDHPSAYRASTDTADLFTPGAPAPF